MKSSIVLFLLSISSSLWGQNLSGDQIIAKVNDLLNPDTCYGKMKMTIQTTSGQERVFEYESWSKNGGEENLLRYLAPRRVRGQATLMLNYADDIWMFFPRTQRVRKLATHAKKQKMEGSDFSYEDMGSCDAFVQDFTSKRLQDERIEGHDCYKVELTKKKDSDSAYSRMIIWVDSEDFVPIVIDYYKEDNTQEVLKRLIQSDIQTIDGIPTAMRMVMYDKRDNTQTSVEFTEIKYNVALENSMFTERALRR